MHSTNHYSYNSMLQMKSPEPEPRAPAHFFQQISCRLSVLAFCLSFPLFVIPEGNLLLLPYAPTRVNRSSNPSPTTVTAISSSDPTIHIAARNSLTSCVPITPSTRQPAATPAPIPEGASSTTTQSSGASPSNSAPHRYGSGSGLPCSTMSPEISRSGTGNPAAASRPSRSRRVAEVTIAQRSGGSRSSSNFAPGNTVRSPVSTISISSITRSPSAT